MSLKTLRTAHLWLPGYVTASRQRTLQPVGNGPVDILFCIADHFEPRQGPESHERERRRVATWIERLPGVAGRFRDAHGRPLQYTFFYPQEQYRPEYLDALAQLCRAGFGEVEVHLHHDGDNSPNLRNALHVFTRQLAQHGLLTGDAGGCLRYGFIHGNWALDNAHPEGRWCGVNDEIDILRDTGCYADFTMPSAPDPCQTRTVNAIYYARDQADQPRSHDYGTPACVNQPAPARTLLMVQGPITIDWTRRRMGFLPGIDNAALDATNPPTVERFRRWVDAGISVAGRPDWVFVKLHGHGAIEENAQTMLGPAMERFLGDVNEAFNDGRRYRLHYVTAREMVNIIRAAEDGRSGDAGGFRDYALPPPPVRRGNSKAG